MVSLGIPIVISVLRFMFVTTYYTSSIFNNIDVLLHISSFIDELMLLPFVLTCKSCLEATILSHRQFLKSSLSYYCQRREMAGWVLGMSQNLHSSSNLINLAAKHGSLDVIKWLRGQYPLSFWSERTCSNAAAWLRAQESPLKNLLAQ